MSTGKRLASVVIAGVLLLQILAAFQITPGPIDGSPWLWPFLDYPMYSTPRYPGDSILRPEIRALHTDTSESRVERSELGLNFWHFRRGLMFSILNDDTSRVRDYAGLYESRTGRALAAFRIYRRPLVLGKSGVDPADPYLVREFEVDGGGEP